MPEFFQIISFDYESMVKHVHVDYCFRSDILNPTALTMELGIQPSRAWAKYEKYLSRRYHPKTKKATHVQAHRPWGIWAIDTKALTSKNPNDHIVYLLDTLQPKSALLQKYLDDKERYSIRFYIWWEPFDGHGSYEISREILERMIKLCHYIEFGFISTTSDNQ